MADLTAQVRNPPVDGQALNYVAVSASDTFTAQPYSSYILHYKNGATATGSVRIVDPTTPVPAGSAAAVGFADAIVAAMEIAASGERIARIPNSNRFRDPATGLITLTHNGTVTTLTVAILGPFPPTV